MKSCQQGCSLWICIVEIFGHLFADFLMPKMATLKAVAVDRIWSITAQWFLPSSYCTVTLEAMFTNLSSMRNSHVFWLCIPPKGCVLFLLKSRQTEMPSLDSFRLDTNIDTPLSSSCSLFTLEAVSCGPRKWFENFRGNGWTISTQGTCRKSSDRKIIKRHTVWRKKIFDSWKTCDVGTILFVRCEWLMWVIYTYMCVYIYLIKDIFKSTNLKNILNSTHTTFFYRASSR